MFLSLFLSTCTSIISFLSRDCKRVFNFLSLFFFFLNRVNRCLWYLTYFRRILVNILAKYRSLSLRFFLFLNRFLALVNRFLLRVEYFSSAWRKYLRSRRKYSGQPRIVQCVGTFNRLTGYPTWILPFLRNGTGSSNSSIVRQ